MTPLLNRINRGIGGGPTSMSMLGFGAVLAVVRIKFWDGVAWVAKPLKVWTGSAWVEKTLKRWDGSQWV